MLASLVGPGRMFNLSCAILRPDAPPTGVEFNRWGAPILSDDKYVAIPGMESIPCIRSSPNPHYRIGVSQEDRNQSRIMEVGQFHILLAGYFPTLQRNWRAIIDLVKFDITLVEWDSRNTTTRLLVQQVII